MDVKDTLEKIKKLLFGGEVLPAHTLNDGKVVNASELSEGKEIFEGEQPLADGTYTLADGTILVVANGIIASVTPPAGAPPADPMEMAKYTLQDGTEVEISTLAEGGNVVIAGVPATEGEYTLSDGTKITVDASGVIVKLTVAGVDPNASVQMSAQEFEAVKAEIKQSFEQQLADVKVTAKAAEDSLKDTISKQAEALKQLFAVVEKLGNEPAGDPPANKKKVVQSFGQTNEQRGGAIDRYAKAARQAQSN